MNNIRLSLLICLFAPSARAQVDTSGLTVSISAYAEPYYGYDFNQPRDGDRPGFVYSHNRHNEFNINIAFLKAALNARRVRGNFALMAGTYANANLAAEPGTLKNMLEANAGIKLAKNQELWLDAGIIGSHIGFESAVGKDCWTLTRSIPAENSPYYEAGARLTYTTPNEKWLFSVLALNGWQHIRRVAGQTALSGGWQIQFNPSGKVTLNSSSFFGTDKPDSLRQWRIFHNFYGIFHLNGRFGITLGLDTGWEENPGTGDGPNFWYSPIVIGRYRVNDRFTLAARAEYYSDEHGVIIATGTPNGFKTLGMSANLDIHVHQNALWRIEGKIFNGKDKIFVNRNQLSANDAAITTALAVWF